MDVNNLALKLMVPVLIVVGWLLFEVVNLVLRRKGHSPAGAGRRLLGWILRPWASWGIVNLVYLLNPGKGLDVMDTSPTFTDWLFPLFIHPWNRHESFMSVVSRLATTPSVYLWGTVILLFAGVLALVIRRIVDGKSIAGKSVIIWLVGLYLLIAGLHLSVASLPNGMFDKLDHQGEVLRKGSLLSCWHAHGTMLYSVPFVQKKGIGFFMRNFSEIQPRLRFTIHAFSHPPGGAVSTYLIGVMAGAKDMNIRLDSTRIRYALGMTFFSALNLFVVFGLGRALFGGNKQGLVAALLWGTAPNIVGYATFAQDGIYAVFFTLSLLLTWRIAMAKKVRYSEMIGLGLVFSALNFMNYSWCLVTMIFALFIVYRAISVRWKFGTLVLRGCAPLGVMTLLSGAILLRYKLDYLEIYKISSCYVREWYQYDTAYQSLISWVGGQVEIAVMMGAVTSSAFIAAMYARVKERSWSPQLVLLLMVLAVYALPILFGPTCLRLETARCWIWVPIIPTCFAANFMLKQSRAKLYVTTAILFSVGSFSLMRLILTLA